METVGILGGGQLAKMISLAALKLGFKTFIYANAKNDPALQCCSMHKIENFEEHNQIVDFANQVSCVTIETENINPKTIATVSNHTRCHISCDILSKMRNRWHEKQLLNSLGLPTTGFAMINNLADVSDFIEKYGYPIVFKSLELGYDGKNQQIIDKKDAQILIPYPFIAEQFVNYSKEISIVVARDYSGNIEFFPIAENTHNRGIMISSKVPADITSKTSKLLYSHAKNLVNELGFIGILAIECFLTVEQDLLINELAPRPHNSAHWSLDACNISQFEQLVRIICNLPMKPVKLLAPCETKNLLGESVLSWKDYTQQANCFPMVYGKSDVYPMRKMGHVNILSAYPQYTNT